VNGIVYQDYFIVGHENIPNVQVAAKVHRELSVESGSSKVDRDFIEVHSSAGLAEPVEVDITKEI